MDNKTYNQSFTITANAQSRVLDTRELNTVLFLVNGTYNLTVVFEGTVDGTTWYPLQVASINAAIVTATHSTANATQGYEANVHSFQQVRVRSTAYTSGTMNLTVSGTSRAVEPAPVVQVSGTIGVAATGQAATGTTTTAINSAASTNAANVKTTAGTLYVVAATNTSASTKYVKFFNKASAPVIGTDSPLITLAIPAGTSVVHEFGQVGMRFSTGINHAITGGVGRLDQTAVAVDDVLLAYNWI